MGMVDLRIFGNLMVNMKNVWLTETMSSVENWFICYWDKTTSTTVCCCRFSTSTASKKLQKNKPGDGETSIS